MLNKNSRKSNCISNAKRQEQQWRDMLFVNQSNTNSMPIYSFPHSFIWYCRNCDYFQFFLNLFICVFSIFIYNFPVVSAGLSFSVRVTPVSTPRHVKTRPPVINSEGNGIDDNLWDIFSSDNRIIRQNVSCHAWPDVIIMMQISARMFTYNLFISSPSSAYS